MDITIKCKFCTHSNLTDGGCDSKCRNCGEILETANNYVYKLESKLKTLEADNAELVVYIDDITDEFIIHEDYCLVRAGHQVSACDCGYYDRLAVLYTLLKKHKPSKEQ